MREYGLYLNGGWTKAGGENGVMVENPATEALIGRVATVGRAEVRQAIDRADQALGGWRRTTARERGVYLHHIADEMERRSEEISRVMTEEAGKPLGQSRGEVAMSVDHLRWFAEEGKRAYGRTIPPQAAGKRNWTIQQPVGVVGAISPWNFPLILGVRKVAPALAAGCTVLLKPSELTPLCNVLFAECVEAAEVPAGVFQLVLGDAAEIAGEMLANPLCRKISFTGSTEVGQKMIAGAAATCTRLSLELGGNAPCLVFEDADLGRAVEGVMMAKFRNSGQSCIAANRILVQGGLYERFVEAFAERVKGLKVGNGPEESVEVGPMISRRAMDKVLEQVDEARGRGARLLAGGKRWGDRGYFVAPTVLADVARESQCMKVETFGPMAPVTRFESDEEGIALANDSSYGLAAYAFTESIDRGMKAAEMLEAGMIGLNDGVPTTTNAPFGGMKMSGWGRELGSEGLEAFMETKHVSMGLKS